MAARRRYTPRRSYAPRRRYSRASSGGSIPVGSILSLGILVGGGLLAWQHRGAIEAFLKDTFGIGGGSKSGGGGSSSPSAFKIDTSKTGGVMYAGGIPVILSPTTLMRQPPAGYQLPFGLFLPNGAMFTGKITQMPPPFGSIDMKTPVYTAEIVLANGTRDQLKVLPK